jgi:hypothetical protein
MFSIATPSALTARSTHRGVTRDGLGRKGRANVIFSRNISSLLGYFHHMLDCPEIEQKRLPKK